MAQFDVFHNPGAQRATIPFVVVLQNSRYDRVGTRFVAPLVLASIARVSEHYIAPAFTVAGREVVLDIFNLATLPAARLSEPVASLADDASSARLLRALDELVSQA